MAMLLRGIALRLTGNPQSAVACLRPLSISCPDAPIVHLQLGLGLREIGADAEAVASLKRAVAVKPDFTDAWYALAALLTTVGDTAAADEAFTHYVSHSGQDPDLARAAEALRRNRVAEAEPLLRGRLERHPLDIAAMCLLADVVARHGLLKDAESLLRRCLELAPSYRAARQNYAIVLMWQNRPGEALEECNQLLAGTPDDKGALNVKANILRRIGEYDTCVEIYQDLLRADPNQPKVWTSFGHTLRTLGKTEQCIEAYRKAIALKPHFGEAYWSLANLKTGPVVDSDLDAMRAQLIAANANDEDRIHLHFAIGKALEDRREFEQSFRHYDQGNRLRRQSIRYEPDELSKLVRRSMALFTPAFFAQRALAGADAPDPIFIVGLPRVGSTLIEQILASHSAVEGTTELPDIATIVKSLEDARPDGQARSYPELLANLDAAELRRLGATYIAQTRVQRKRATPFFTDKMPNNFAHVGFIHLVLPNARIIDVRRHPLACGLSLFKLLFGHGQHFAYSLEDIARYYRDYAVLMAHFDRVLPGRVHRVTYEALVNDTETEVRRMLDYCGLPFEDACLSFHQNRRAVSTPSAEQVRMPVFRESLDLWRHYEPWLDPLKRALGSLIDAYPEVPQDLLDIHHA